MVSLGWMGDAMSSPENPIGKGVHGMAVDPKGGYLNHPVVSRSEPASLPPIPFPEIATPDGIPAETSRKPETNKHKLRQRIALILGSAAITAGAGYAGYEAYQNIPEVHQGIEQQSQKLYQKVIDQISPNPTIPDIPAVPTYSNNLGNQILEAGVNAVPVTKEDLSSISNESIGPSTKDNPYPTLQLLFPGMLQEKDRVSIKKRGGVIRGTNLSTGEVSESPYHEGSFDFIIQRQGTKIIHGILDGQAKTIEVYKLPTYLVNDVPYFRGVLIRVTRDDGSIYEMSFRPDGDVRFLKPLAILDDAPQLEYETIQLDQNSSRLIYVNGDKPGKIVSGTTPIMKTGLENAKIVQSLGGSGISGDNAITAFRKTDFAIDSNNQLVFIPDSAN